MKRAPSKVKSEAESDIENFSEDSDTEYVARKPFPTNKKENHHQKITGQAEGKVLDIDQ